MKRILGFIAIAVPMASAYAQYSTGFESPGYTGSAGGTLLTGQQGWYVPVAGSIDHNVFTYAGNSFGVAANPTGGSQFSAGVGGATPARAQHDLNMSVGDVWSFSYDVLGMYTGQLPAVNNLGSFSSQNFTLGAHQSFIALNVWDDVNTAASWSAQYNVYDAAGVAINNQSAGSAWAGLTPNRWYRQETRVNFATNQVTFVAITDLTTNVTTSFSPTTWYLNGGANNPGGLPRPTGFRMFAGGANSLMAFDNVSVPEPATLAVLGLGVLAAAARRRKKA